MPHGIAVAGGCCEAELLEYMAAAPWGGWDASACLARRQHIHAHTPHARASTHARTHALTSSGADVGLADGDSVSDDFVKAWDATAFVRPPPLRASLTAIEGDRRQEASGLGTASAPYSSERFGFRLSESLPQPEAGGAYAGWIREHVLALVRGDG